jgi:transcriptional regulator with XRE-family HTH domain
MHNAAKGVRLLKKTSGFVHTLWQTYQDAEKTKRSASGQAGSNTSYLGEIELGLKNPSYDVLVNIAWALGTTFAEISREIEKDAREDIERMKKKNEE